MRKKIQEMRETEDLLIYDVRKNLDGALVLEPHVPNPHLTTIFSLLCYSKYPRFSVQTTYFATLLLPF
jgi:hypothetical protein